MTAMLPRPISANRFFLVSAAGLTLWLLAAFLWHFTFGHGRELPHILFLDQDMGALLLALAGMTLLAPLAGGGGSWQLPAPDARIVLPLILLFALWSWAGHYLVFQDYALSRDEEVAEFAAAYMRDGLLARPIPAEWLDYRRAIMPEFFSPFGAEAFWTSAYLPLNSAIRALFWHLGDPNLASPALLVIGLIALWRVALRMFPGRPDAVWVALLMGLTSAQLSVTGMTAFAMTGHFAFNMVWLALFLRGGWSGHVGAGVVAILAAGLHQWHYPIIFLLPFIGWLLLQRRWGAAAFHFVTVAVLVGVYAKLYPWFLIHELGPASDIRPSAGVADKVGSLFARVAARWQPLLNITRFIAWNNILLLPLALLAVAGMNARRATRGETIVLPLAFGCAAGLSLAIYQAYGWGFRYAHAFIGPFCLLAGFGWVRLGQMSLRPVLLASALSLLAGGFLTVRAHDYVAPYARVHRLIQESGAEVVLVDGRGGLFVSDLVRGEHGVPGSPMVMNLALLRRDQVEALCARYDIALLDRSAFLSMGIRPARWQFGHVAVLRQRMAERRCGHLIEPRL